MSDFSQRFGYAPPILDLPEDQMPESLRAGLWDICRLFYLKDISDSNPYGMNPYSKTFNKITYHIWFSFFRISVDDRPQNPLDALQYLKQQFKFFSFFKVYAFLEFLVKVSKIEGLTQGFETPCNSLFERERSAFRFADGQLIKVSNAIDLEEVTTALSQDYSPSVKQHIKRAAELYSQLPNPDYRNSIKESISAVEAAVCFVTGEKPAGISKPLKGALDRYGIHAALSAGFEKLYAYTSDADGIRHALLDESKLAQSDARYMLVSCNAFSNYLFAKVSES